MIHPLRHIQRSLEDILHSSPRRDGKRYQSDSTAFYGRFSDLRLQRDSSIDDQLREAIVFAGQEIPPHLQFSDKGVSGAEHQRKGLCRMLEAAANGEFKELILFSLSRLAREHIITITMLKWLKFTCGVRVRSKVEGLDTDTVGWELQATILAVFAEQARKEIQENVRRGAIGSLLSLYSVGDYPFGYTSEPDPSGASRTFRGLKIPKRIYAINNEEAVWVKRIFGWFVSENRSLQWIVHKLNESEAPRDHRATNKHWDRSSVRRVLKSTKYIGLWTWGRRKNCRSPITGMKFRELRSEEEFRTWNREFPQLRIIDDETFHLAHLKLKANEDRVAAFRRDSGKLGGAAGPNGVPRHLLQGLLRCSTCGSPMHVTGPNGMYLRCRGFRDGICDQRSQLPRTLAERAILKVVSDRILCDGLWIDEIVARAISQWHKMCAELPSAMELLRLRLRECEAQITKIVTRMAQTDEPIPELNAILKNQRSEKVALERDLADASNRLGRAPREPKRQWIVGQLVGLDSLLRSETPAATVALAGLLSGSILVSTIPAARRIRKAFRLEIPMTVDHVLHTTGLLGTAVSLLTDQKSSPLIIDVERPSRGRTQAQEAWTLLHEGKAAKDIALELGVSRSRMTAILHDLAETNPKGLSVKELHALARSMRTAPPKLAERLEPQVMLLFNEGRLIEDIATALRCSDATVHKAITNWHRTHGLAVPDGRTRRKQLTVKVRVPLSDRTREDV